jgi:hypothetical protein
LHAGIPWRWRRECLCTAGAVNTSHAPIEYARSRRPAFSTSHAHTVSRHLRSQFCLRGISFDHSLPLGTTFLLRRSFLYIRCFQIYERPPSSPHLSHTPVENKTTTDPGRNATGQYSLIHKACHPHMRSLNTTHSPAALAVHRQTLQLNLPAINPFRTSSRHFAKPSSHAFIPCRHQHGTHNPPSKSLELV